MAQLTRASVRFSVESSVVSNGGSVDFSETRTRGANNVSSLLSIKISIHIYREKVNHLVIFLFLINISIIIMSAIDPFFFLFT